MSRFDTWTDGSSVSPCVVSPHDELGLPIIAWQYQSSQPFYTLAGLPQSDSKRSRQNLPGFLGSSLGSYSVPLGHIQLIIGQLRFKSMEEQALPLWLAQRETIFGSKVLGYHSSLCLYLSLCAFAGLIICGSYIETSVPWSLTLKFSTSVYISYVHLSFCFALLGKFILENFFYSSRT